MNQRRSILVTIAILALLPLALTVSGALAQAGPSGMTVPDLSRLKDSARLPANAVPDAPMVVSAATSLTSTFTYQGQLKNASGPITGNCNFQFSLWDSPANLTGQIGTTQAKSNIALNNGLFTVQLDFGKSAFAGEARYLQIAVSCPPGGNFTLLTPRQLLTPAPNAVYSSSTGALQGNVISTSAPGTGQVLKWDGSAWSPGTDSVGPSYSAGFGLGLTFNQFRVVTATVQQRVSGACASGSAMRVVNADGSVICQPVSYSNVIIVAKSGGDYATVTDALNGITSASDTNRYLIKVMPGVYSETVTMKPYVDIEGSGELTTKITQVGSGSTLTGTVNGADNAELRFLTVESTGGSLYYAIGICNNSASPHLTHVTINADPGSTSYGIYNNASSPTLNDVTILSSGETYDYGIYNTSSSPTLMNVRITAMGHVWGIGVYNSASSPLMMNVTAVASSSYAFGVMYGVDNENGSSPKMTNVNASASGGAINYGVYNSHSAPTMTNVVATIPTGANANNYGVYNDSSTPLLSDVTAFVSGGTSSTNTGVYNTASAPTMTGMTIVISGTSSTNYGVNNAASAPAMMNTTIIVSGTASTNYGMYSTGSSPTMANVNLTVSGGTSDYGIWDDTSSASILNSDIRASGGTSDGMHNVASSGTYLVTINNSQITGGTSTIYQSSTSYTTKIGASQINGGGAFGGTYACVFTYNGNYAALNNTCQ